MANSNTTMGATALLSASIAALACAGAPPPTDRMATAEAATRAAHEVGAERVPKADLQFKLASDEIANGRALMKNGDNAKADLMFQRADADAELALALAREDSARAEAGRALDQTGAFPKQPATLPDTTAPEQPGATPGVPPPPGPATTPPPANP